MQNTPNQILGHPLDRQSIQNGNLERSAQQAIGEGEKLDVQIPQPSGETDTDQDGSASNSNLYDVHFSRPQKKYYKK